MSSRNNTDFAPDRTNFGRFSAVSSNPFIQNHSTHNVFFSGFEFFSNEVNTCFFNHFSDCVIFRKSINFFLNKFFSFFKLFLPVSSIEVVVSINNHIVSSFFDNLFNFCSIVRVYEFFFYDTASFSKFNLSFALFFNFALSELNSSHNIIFRNEFATGFNHDDRIVSTCNDDVEVRFVSLLVSRVSD